MYAEQLVEFVREKHGEWFTIGVAGTQDSGERGGQEGEGNRGKQSKEREQRQGERATEGNGARRVKKRDNKIKIARTEGELTTAEGSWMQVECVAGNCALVHGEVGADGEEGSSQTATDNMTSATDVSATDVSGSDDDTPARPKQR